MSQVLVETITSQDPAIRNHPLKSLLEGMSVERILQECEGLERFRRSTDNLYQGVRACLFLFAAHRFHLQEAPGVARVGAIPFEGYVDLLERRFEPAIARFRQTLRRDGPNSAVLSALAEAYHHLGFQTLTDQVRRSVRGSRGNQWMFRVGHRADHPVRIRPELLHRAGGCPLYPILCERTPVRIDLSHATGTVQCVVSVDMDWLECMTFFDVQGRLVGQMDFAYHETLEDRPDPSTLPRIREGGVSVPDSLWFLTLAEERSAR